MSPEAEWFRLSNYTFTPDQSLDLERAEAMYISIVSVLKLCILLLLLLLLLCCFRCCWFLGHRQLKRRFCRGMCRVARAGYWGACRS